MGKKILIPLAEGFEMIEALSIVDVFRRAGAHGSGAARHCHGRGKEKGGGQGHGHQGLKRIVFGSVSLSCVRCRSSRRESLQARQNSRRSHALPPD